MAIKTLTNTNTKFKGNQENDSVTGSAIADSIAGGLGNDTLFGNAGKDTIDGGNGNDLIDGGADADKLLGGMGDDSLMGSDGNDTLDGGAGNDTLDGGTGADSMVGGAGNDVFYINNSGDKVNEATAASGGKSDTVIISVPLNWKGGNFSVFTGIENYTLTGEEDLTVAGDNNPNIIEGNDGNCVMYGNGGNDTLNGGSGADTLDGGAGKDVLNGGEGDDTYLITNVEDSINDEDGIDTIQSTQTISIANYNTVENLTLAGTKQIDGTGNDNDNLIVGNLKDNRLDANAGNDTLEGGEGNDTLIGGEGSNVLDGGEGDADLALYDDESSNYTLSLTDGVWEVTNANTGDVDRLTNIELIQFSDTPATLLEESSNGSDSGDPLILIEDLDIQEGNTNGKTIANIVIKLDRATSSAVSVEVRTENGTAIAGQDYQALSPQTVTIPAGDTTAKFNIPIISDTIAEANETFFINLANPQGADLSSSVATVTILNDDKTSLAVASEAISVTEGDKAQPSAKVVVSMPSAAANIVTVDYKMIDGTATSTGSSPDFSALSGTLTFQVGQTSQTIMVPIIDDLSVENAENFKVVLSNPTGATLGSSNATTVTILDNDAVASKPTLSMDSTTLSVGENAGNAQVKVSLSAAATTEVTVLYDVSEGTAKSGTDFTAASKQSLIFKAGEVFKVISVPVLEDTVVEGDETFNVVLSNANGANLGANSAATVTITDNDKANQVPVATADNYQNLTAGAAVTKAVTELLSNDKDPDGGTLAITAVSNAVGGTVALDANKANFTYTPTNASVTAGSFQYSLADGQGGSATGTVNLTFVAAASATTNTVTSLPKDARAYDFELPLSDKNDPFKGSLLNEKVLGLGGNDTLEGTEGNDYLDGGDGDDNIDGGEGDDYLLGGPKNDTISGAAGNDSIDGGEGNNNINDDKGDNVIVTGSGDDYIYAAGGINKVSPGAGNDHVRLGDHPAGSSGVVLDGMSGNDTLESYGSDDTIIGGEGNDSLYLGDEQGILGYGGLGDDRIEGYYGSLAYGGDGNDTLFYSKKMFGEAGNDTLQGYYGNNETFVGGLGADKITTQGGKDVVEYYTLTESGVGAGNRDIITDFDTTSGDVIDLYRLASGLSYISAKAFDGGKNQVRLDIQAANQITVVQVDTDGDKAADMEIELTGIKVLVADDFVLVKPVV